jgi:hypothetical protein
MLLRIAFGALLLVSIPQSLRADTPEATWTRLAGPDDPTPAYEPLVLRDARRHRMLTIDTTNPFAIELLSLDADPEWSRVETFETPMPRRIESVAVYDSVGDRAIFFGGDLYASGGTVVYSDVWTLSLADHRWTRLTPDGVPPPPAGRYRAIYDPPGQRMIVMSSAMRLWELDLSSKAIWRPIDPSGMEPPSRGGASVVYDPWNQAMIMFGGYHAIEELPCYGPLYGDTWALRLDGLPRWSKIETPVSPPGRMDASAVIDSDHGQMLVQGGNPYDCTPDRPIGDAWALDLVGPRAWHFVASGLALQDGHGAIFSPERGNFIRYAGDYGSCFELDRARGTWSRILSDAPVPDPVRRPSAAMVVDHTSGGFLAFGGVCRHDLWKFTPGSVTPWESLATVGVATGCGEMAFAHDTRRNRLVSFGLEQPGPGPGYIKVAAMPLDGDRTWTRLQPLGEGPISTAMAMVYDPVRDRILAFGGVEYPSPAMDCGISHDDLWELTLEDPPTWRMLHPIGTAGPRDAAGITYDPIGDRLIVSGGEIQTQPMWLGCNARDLFDTWSLSMKDLTWSRIDAVSPVSFRSIRFDGVQDRVLGLSPSMDVYALPLDRPGVWRRIDATGDTPRPRPAPGWAFDPVLDRLVFFGGSSNADVYALQFDPKGTPYVDVPSSGPVDAFRLRAKNPISAEERPILTFATTREGPATLQVFDVAGRLLHEVELPGVTAGETRIPVDSTRLRRAGVSLARIRQAGWVARARWIVVPAH